MLGKKEEKNIHTQWEEKKGKKGTRLYNTLQ